MEVQGSRLYRDEEIVYSPNKYLETEGSKD